MTEEPEESASDHDDDAPFSENRYKSKGLGHSVFFVAMLETDNAI